MHAAFEVTVAGKHRGNGNIAFVDRFLDGFIQRTGVADTGRAAIADEAEAHRIHVLLQPGSNHIVGHNLAARRKRCLHPGFG